MASPFIFNGAFAKNLLKALRLGSATADPASAQAGDVYFNSTGTQLKYYDGSGWQVVGTGSTVNIAPVATATPSAASTTTISGLNGNSDKNYRIVIRGSWDAATNAPMLMRPNNDSTVGNYNGVYYFYYSGAPIAAAWTTSSMQIAQHAYAAGTVNYVNIEIVLAATSGQPRTIFANTGWCSTTTLDGGYQFAGGGWQNTASNVTSLVFDWTGGGTGTFTGTVNVYKNSY